MLLNNVSAREKAQKMIDKAGIQALVYDPYWIYEHDDKESAKDLYVFYIKGDNYFSFPGCEIPLFYRDGTESDIKIGVPC